MTDPVTGLIVGGATIGSSILGANAAGDAADAQVQASENSNALQASMFNQTQKNIKPFLDVGTKAANAITSSAGLDTDNPLDSPLLKAINMDQATLEKTPGYQFQLAQGLKSTQNSAAARGLGTSGAALKGAASFATGLADSNYQTQLNNAIAQQTNQFNKLYSLVGTGQSSAVGEGQIAQNVAANMGENIVGAGNAQASGILGQANAYTSGINNAFTASMLGGGGAGGGANNFGPFNSGAYANGLPWSDRRVKENIKFHAIENGIPVFEFNYVWDKAKKYIGVMAQNVKEYMPEAVIEHEGVLKVDYDKLGVNFREVSYAG